MLANSYGGCWLCSTHPQLALGLIRLNATQFFVPGTRLPGAGV